jgi:predicted metal-binding membrane protein
MASSASAPAFSLRLALVRRDRVQAAALVLLLALAALAWVVTGDRMQGMDMGPGTDLGSVGFYVSVWVAMMAAMMFPSISPMVLTYGLVQRRRTARGATEQAGATVAFVAGYLVVWTAFGLAAYGLFEVVRSLSIDALSWQRGGRYLAAGVILAAAVYQLTPAKDACLTRCRGPLGFLTDEWREGRLGALVMGILHGGWCVGCCWALMAALFALGVMSIAWMAFVALLIAVEKMLPWKRAANLGIAVALCLLAIAVAVAPESVPGLAIPTMSHM